ncbi:MAG: hypothetical protein ABJE95_08065 [Byssovorax sp.]
MLREKAEGYSDQSRSSSEEEEQESETPSVDGGIRSLLDESSSDDDLSASHRSIGNQGVALLEVSQRLLDQANRDDGGLREIARSRREIAQMERREAAYADLVQEHAAATGARKLALFARKRRMESKLGARGPGSFARQLSVRRAACQQGLQWGYAVVSDGLGILSVAEIEDKRRVLERDKRSYRRVIARERARARAVERFPVLLHSYKDLAKSGAAYNVDASISIGVDVFETLITALGHGVPIPSSWLAALDVDLKVGVTGTVATGDDTKIRPSLTFSITGGVGLDLFLAKVAAEASASFGKGETYDDLDHFVAHYMKTLALIVRGVSAWQLRKLERMENSGATDEAEDQVRAEAFTLFPDIGDPAQIQGGSDAYTRLLALQQRKPVKSTVVGGDVGIGGEDLTGLVKAGISSGLKLKKFTKYVDADAFSLANPGKGRRRKITKYGTSIEARIQAQVGPFKVGLAWERFDNDANPDNDGNYLTLTIGGAATAFLALLSPAPAAEGAVPEAGGTPVEGGGTQAAPEGAPTTDTGTPADGAAAPAEGAVAPEVAPEVAPSAVSAFASSIMAALQSAKVSLGSLADIKLDSILGGVLDIAVPTKLPFGVSAGVTGGATLQYTWANPSAIPLRKKWRLLYSRWLRSRGIQAGLDHIHLYGGITAGGQIGLSKTRALKEHFGTNTLDYVKAQYLGMKKHEQFALHWATLVQKHRPELNELFTRICDPGTHAHREAVKMNIELGEEAIPTNVDDPTGADFDAILQGIRQAFDHEQVLRSSLNVGMLKKYGWKPGKRTRQ